MPLKKMARRAGSKRAVLSQLVLTPHWSHTPQIKYLRESERLRSERGDMRESRGLFSGKIFAIT